MHLTLAAHLRQLSANTCAHFAASRMAMGYLPRRRRRRLCCRQASLRRFWLSNELNEERGDECHQRPLALILQHAADRGHRTHERQAGAGADGLCDGADGRRRV